MFVLFDSGFVISVYFCVGGKIKINKDNCCIGLSKWFLRFNDFSNFIENWYINFFEIIV